ncbi:MAG: hypothetical protein LBM27_02400 [Lactobacillaceae bacterium]|jgi:hypothetical protein|nr:hypothetical protein [Lactobacillaceae bacterium]
MTVKSTQQALRQLIEPFFINNAGLLTPNFKINNQTNDLALLFWLSAGILNDLEGLPESFKRTLKGKVQRTIRDTPDEVSLYQNDFELVMQLAAIKSQGNYFGFETPKIDTILEKIDLVPLFNDGQKYQELDRKATLTALGAYSRKAEVTEDLLKFSNIPVTYFDIFNVPTVETSPEPNFMRLSTGMMISTNYGTDVSSFNALATDIRANILLLMMAEARGVTTLSADIPNVNELSVNLTKNILLTELLWFKDIDPGFIENQLIERYEYFEQIFNLGKEINPAILATGYWMAISTVQ